MSDKTKPGAKPKAGSSWNFKQLTTALIVGVVSQALFLPCLCAVGIAKGALAFSIDGLVALRMLAAFILGEKNRGWVFYCVLCYTSVIWIELASWIVIGKH